MAIMSDLLLVLSNRNSGPIAQQLVSACNRSDKRVAIFLTGDAAVLAGDNRFSTTFANAQAAIVCAESWELSASQETCLVQLGSQTDHSRLAADANNIISL